MALALLLAGPALAGAQPVAGGWTGWTSDGRDLSFRVGTGGSSLTFLYFEYRMGSCSVTTSTSAPVPIGGGQFYATNSDPCNNYVVSGTFTSPSAAAGNFSVSRAASCSCPGSTGGAWVAYGPPASLCPAGTVASTLFFDNLESIFSGNWTNPVFSGVNHWAGCAGSPPIYCSFQPASGSYHFRGYDAPSVGDSAVAMSPPVRTFLPAGSRMQFDHSYSFERGTVIGNPTLYYFDGVVVEYSPDGGASWFDAGALVAEGGRYRNVIYGGFGNPLGGRGAFVGSSHGYTTSQLDLGGLAGASVQLRFRVGTDSTVSNTGWYVDNVRLYRCGPAPPASVSDATCAEGDAGTTPCSFTIALGAAVGENVTLNWTTADGTATAGSDYVAASGSSIIAAGSTVATVPVLVQGDVLDEDDETFTLRLTSAVNAVIADGQGVGRITDDDPTPTLTVADVTMAEGNAGTTAAPFTAALSAPSGRTVRLTYATSDLTATAGSDYDAVSAVVEIPRGAASWPLPVRVRGDRVAEPDESFLVDLTQPVNVVLNSTTATGTITNDDPPGLSVEDAAIVEPDSGTRDLVFAVNLAPAPAGPVTVDYATVDGTATAPDDFTFTSGQLAFDPTTLTRTVSVPVNADALIERSETFVLKLSNPSAGTPLAHGGEGIGTILDPGNFHTLPPCRLVDTRLPDAERGGPALDAGQQRTFVLAGACGVPNSARALSVNVAVTQPTVAGHLRIFPAGSPLPLVSAINYAAGQTRANNAVLPLGQNGAITVRCNQATGTVHFIVDVNGYFE
jgi:hypothetical protein